MTAACKVWYTLYVSHSDEEEELLLPSLSLSLIDKLNGGAASREQEFEWLYGC
jgi:hypothetical protein